MFRIFAFAMLLVSSSATADEYEGSSFNEVWEIVDEGDYDVLPDRTTTLSSLIGLVTDPAFQAAQRTLNDYNDIRPQWEKLVHPTGICLAGDWEITEDNPYTGYFAKGSKGLMIARVSEAMGFTKRGNYRSFGLAGKIFPTTDSNEVVKTANFFTVDDLGGTKVDRFTKTKLTNEPAVTVRLRSPRILAIAARVASAFTRADGNPGFRPLYEISRVGVEKGKEKTPKWIRISATNETTPIKDHADFRHELHIDNFESGLAFDVEVKDEDESWSKIGKITIFDDAASEACDTKLHFHHPKLDG